MIIDFVTRFVWLFAVKSTTSQETIKHLNSLFDIFGNPKQLVSDRGTAFTSEFADFLRFHNIQINRCGSLLGKWSSVSIDSSNHY